ncbi:MAG: hypothetical protein AMXMBFR13_48000 [Phycisphaerae bacterium]
MKRFVLMPSLLLTVSALAAGPAPGTRGHYRGLPAEPHAVVPFEAVDFTYGALPDGAPDGAVLWQLEVRAKDDGGTAPLFQLRALTSRDPLADSAEPLTFLRYLLRIPETNEALEYINVHTGLPLLPAWGEFVLHFIPRPAKATRRQQGMPNTCEYLGHVLTLQYAADSTAWPEWPDVKVLKLDPELLIGTSRNFKDKEGQRLPQHPERRNYTYIPFTGDDYRVMLEAGINEFTVGPEQEQFVRGEPVFYLRRAAGSPALRYPADLYRSNYIGSVMFMDEPTIIMVGDKNVHNTLRYFTDATALITKRVRSRYWAGGNYGAYNLEAQLEGLKISFGDMRLAQLDYPSWETIYETAFYQLAGGTAGLVHEGRYQLKEFNEYVQASTGLERDYTAEEMFKYVFGTLRGAARAFDKDWGISIYGQADPKLSDLALSMAYDMGARYLWYWTSDHDHHMPWPEQLELTRAIRKHMAASPRASIRGSRPVLDKAIAIPYGYWLTLESPTTRKVSSDLWWVRELDPEKQNESSQRYRRLMRNAFTEVQKALDAGESFDITIDDGREISGYRKVVRVKDE